MSLTGAVVLEQRRGRLEAAMERFQQTLALAPQHPGALRRMANVLRQLGRDDESREYAQRALAQQPRNPNNP